MADMIDDLDFAADDRPWIVSFLLHNWPYLAMLALALIGVALSSVSPGPMIIYWEALVPIFAVICFFARRPQADGKASLPQTIRIEVVHWAAVFLAMRLLMLPDLTQLLNSDAIALMLLTLLALGVITAGNQTGSWRIGIVGALMALAVPAIAWLDRAALLVAVGLVAIAALAVFALVRRA